MKKILMLLLLGTTLSAFAHGPYFRPRYYHDGWGWVAPALIGGAVVYAATRPPVVVQQPPVVVANPPVVEVEVLIPHVRHPIEV